MEGEVEEVVAELVLEVVTIVGLDEESVEE